MVSDEPDRFYGLGSAPLAFRWGRLAPQPEPRSAVLPVPVRLRVVKGERIAPEIASRVSQHAVCMVRVILRAVVLDQKVVRLHAVVVRRPRLRRTCPREDQLLKAVRLQQGCVAVHDLLRQVIEIDPHQAH